MRKTVDSEKRTSCNLHKILYSLFFIHYERLSSSTICRAAVIILSDTLNPFERSANNKGSTSEASPFFLALIMMAIVPEMRILNTSAHFFAALSSIAAVKSLFWTAKAMTCDSPLPRFHSDIIAGTSTLLMIA